MTSTARAFPPLPGSSWALTAERRPTRARQLSGTRTESGDNSRPNVVFDLRSVRTTGGAAVLRAAGGTVWSGNEKVGWNMRAQT